jgi:hypothetical protein
MFTVVENKRDVFGKETNLIVVLFLSCHLISEYLLESLQRKFVAAITAEQRILHIYFYRYKY